MAKFSEYSLGNEDASEKHNKLVEHLNKEFLRFDVGSAISSATPGGDTDVLFNRTLAAVPIVCATTTDGPYACRIKSATESGCVVVINTANVHFNWIAIVP